MESSRHLFSLYRASRRSYILVFSQVSYPFSFGFSSKTLSLIKRSNIQFGGPTIIKIPDRIKTFGINRNQPYMTFPVFKDHSSLCLVSLLRYYINKTEQLLPSSDALFVTSNKSTRAASSQTISR